MCADRDACHGTGLPAGLAAGTHALAAPHRNTEAPEAAAGGRGMDTPLATATLALVRCQRGKAVGWGVAVGRARLTGEQALNGPDGALSGSLLPVRHLA